MNKEIKTKNYKYCVSYHYPSRTFFEMEITYSDPWLYGHKVLEFTNLKHVKKFMAFVKLFGYA